MKVYISPISSVTDRRYDDSDADTETGFASPRLYESGDDDNAFGINVVGPDWFVEKTKRALRLAERSRTAREHISLLKTIHLSAHELGVNATVGASNPDFMDFGYVWVNPDVDEREDEDYMGTLVHEGGHCWLTLNGYSPCIDEDDPNAYPNAQRRKAQQEV